MCCRRMFLGYVASAEDHTLRHSNIDTYVDKYMKLKRESVEAHEVTCD